MPGDARHIIPMTSVDAHVVERGLRGWATMLQATGEFRATEQIKVESDHIAHITAVVQEHVRDLCDCNKRGGSQ